MALRVPLILVVLWAVSSPENARGGNTSFGLAEPTRWRTHRADVESAFIFPNEHHPEAAIPIWDQANDGIYVSVGTERGFIGAGYTRASHLVLADSDANVVLFNRLNAALLAAAPSRQEYLRLRTSAPLTEVSRVLASSPYATSTEHALFTAPQTLPLFFGLLRRTEEPYNFVDYHRGTDDLVALSIGGSRVSYLFNDGNFEHLQSLARRHRIRSVQTNLANGADVALLRSLIDQLQSTDHTALGVVDLSNAWWHYMINWQRTQSAVDTLGEISGDDTLFLFTERTNNNRDWIYSALSGDSVRHGGEDGTRQFLALIRRLDELGEVETLNGTIDGVPAALAAQIRTRMPRSGSRFPSERLFASHVPGRDVLGFERDGWPADGRTALPCTPTPRTYRSIIKALFKR